MSMKSLNKKEALKIIQTRLEEGKPRKEILEELTSIYNDKSSISKLIAMTPNSKTKEKYKLLNYILLCLIVLFFIPFIVLGILHFSAKQPVETIIVGFVALSFFIYCIFQVSKFKGYIYGGLASLIIFTIIFGLNLIDTIFKSGIWNVYLILIFLALGGLALYLSKKMFPNYGLYGVKKDKNGDYLLE
jgi:hypothetical protein